MDHPSLCPTCKGPTRPYPENPAHPFCGKRCKLADLSNWFNERYAVAGEASGDGGDEHDELLH